MLYGMSEKEFWEDDPQLYWAYHILFIKKEKKRIEELQYSSWLLGKMNYIAHSCSLKDGFSKEASKGFPTFDEMFGSTNEENINKSIDERKEEQMTAQQNYWARR